MRKYIYIIAVIVMLLASNVISSCGKTKINHNSEDTVTWCNYYAVGSLDWEINEMCDSLESTFDNHQDTIYYSRLTELVCEKLYNKGDWWSSVPTDELLHNKKFMHIMDEGFDGLCTIDPEKNPKLGNAISYFMGAYNYAGK